MKMKRSDCKKAFPSLCAEWVKDAGLTPEELKHPSFSAFKSWLRARAYDHYLNFRSRAGSDYDAELWFDQEFKQTWRR